MSDIVPLKSESAQTPPLSLSARFHSLSLLLPIKSNGMSLSYMQHAVRLCWLATYSHFQTILCCTHRTFCPSWSRPQLQPRAASETGVETLQVVFCYHTAAVVASACSTSSSLKEKRLFVSRPSRGQNLVGFCYIVTWRTSIAYKLITHQKILH